MGISKKLHVSKHIFYLIGGAFLLLTIFGSLLIAGTPKPKSALKQGKIQEITLQNDQAKLRIQRNGVVEIATRERTVFQFWDEERVARLFNLLEKTDWSKFSNRLQPGQKGYLLTIKTVDGEITVAIPEESVDLPDAVVGLLQLFDQVVEQVGGGATPSPSYLPLVSPAPGASATPKPSTVPSPTPTPRASTAPSVTPAPTPTPTGVGGSSSKELFVCHYTGTTVKKRILSETLCDLVE